MESFFNEKYYNILIKYVMIIVGGKMIILHICDNTEVLSVMSIINTIITIIQIVVPIILIITLMIAYTGAISDETALAKVNRSAVSKMTAALLIFIIPTFINIIINAVGFDNSNYINCFKNANQEYISQRRYTDAKTALDFVSESLSQIDYNNALNKISLIKDVDQKNELLDQLEEIKDKMDKKSNTQVINIPSGQSSSISNRIGVYYYRQCDERWGNIEYDNKTDNHATLCSSSCGYTSLAMIASGLNDNENINPYTVVKDIRNIKDGKKTSYGYGAASWDDLTNSSNISRYNLEAKRINRSEIEAHLTLNHPVIALVPNHYIVLSINNDGKVVLLDPYDNWADSRRKSGTFNSVSEIEAIYGKIDDKDAAAYWRK